MLHTDGSQKVVLEQSQAYFLRVLRDRLLERWALPILPSYQQHPAIVRKETAKKLAWRSRILNLDMQTHPYKFIGKDRQIRHRHLEGSE